MEHSFIIRRRKGLIALVDMFGRNVHGDVMVHRVSFWQKGSEFKALGVKGACRLQCYSSVRDLNLTNLSIRADGESHEVTFFYDERRSGQPVRRGHNKDYYNVDSFLYCHDILNETAFSLRQGQYGRVIWNERKRDCDTGEWYYQLHVVNLLQDLGEVLKQDIFLTGRTDFEYRQMAVLY